MPAPAAILDLVARFGEHIDAYKTGSYNETQLRRDFLDPFFKELGWDVDNTAGYAETYRDVIHEDQVKVGGALKAPDYGFYIGGSLKFFLEAKKPSVRIKDDITPAYQVRRYGWNAGLPISILSDFEEFAIYDTRIKAKPGDPASKARIFYCHYTEYAEKWDFIAAIFAKQSILKGGFDKFATTAKGKRGTSEVDADFLATIEGWRADLARNLALRNPALTQRELNFAVQRVIDRIIFLRICEDRGIEDYERLKNAATGKGVYQSLLRLFQQADDRYNSGLFHFRAEKGRHEAHDTLTPRLVIDDELLKQIIRHLYFPDCDYEFKYMPADILGRVYEQFLGKVIRLTENHQAKVEDKPEVKKSGGVFYTPTYIVDYIVRQTVGPLIEGRTPKQIEKVRVLDPACGSGSFLIGAFQFLLDWHHRQYTTHDPETHAKGKNPKLVAASGGGWKLTTTERKRILLAHIYGVDIDSQAVEVTKLSLLLKVLEGETAQTVQRELIQERVLPDLGDNIKCGNSLIGSDFYAQANLPAMDADARLRINVFDWAGKDGFPEIMQAGGFDAVIGNPPWGSMFSEPEKQYLWSGYVNKMGEAESHLFFLEKSCALLNSKGQVGFITPNTWLNVNNSAETRQFLLANTALMEIRELSKNIFADAPDIVPIIFIARKKREDHGCCRVSRPLVTKLTATNYLTAVTDDEIDPGVWLKNTGFVINIRSTAAVINLTSKCAAGNKTLRAVGDLVYGIKTGDNEKYVALTASKTHSVKALKSGEIGRYALEWKGFWLWWCDQLAGFRKTPVAVPKIVIQYIRKISMPRRIVATLDASGEFYPLNNYSYITARDDVYPLPFLLALLNSSLLNFYFANTFIDYNIKPAYLGKLPIALINSEATAKAKDRIVSLAEKMLSLHLQRAAAKTPHEQTALDRQIGATDALIDREVYALYRLTPEEIALVEGSSAPEEEPSAPDAAPSPASILDATLEYPHKTGYRAHMVFREDPVEYAVTRKPEMENTIQEEVAP